MSTQDTTTQNTTTQNQGAVMEESVVRNVVSQALQDTAWRITNISSESLELSYPQIPTLREVGGKNDYPDFKIKVRLCPTDPRNNERVLLRPDGYALFWIQIPEHPNPFMGVIPMGENRLGADELVRAINALK